MNRAWRKHSALALFAMLALAPGGCSLGPRALQRTHGAYEESVRQVYEEELLRNLVHMRYNEGPSNLDVSNIAAQYELSAQAEARPFFSTESTGNLFRSFRAILPDAQVSGTNRPTISLTPSDDGTSVRRFLTTIPPETLLLLARTSWPLPTLLSLWVERINGVPNAVPASGPPRDVVPDFARFRRVAELLQVIQDRELGSVHAEASARPVSGPLAKEAVTAAAAVEAAKNGMEYRPRPGGPPATWELIRRETKLVFEVNPAGQGSPEVAEVMALLHLRPGLGRYDVVVRGSDIDPLRHQGPLREEVRVVLRSTAQVFFYLANGVEVPPEHVAAGVATLPVDESGAAFDRREVTRGLFQVHSCKGRKPPPTAYLAVCYRGYWFYIDDQDQASKATFELVIQLSRLDLARQRPTGPALTLPVGR